MKEQFISMKTTSNPAKFVSGCEEISAYSRKANSFKSLSAEEEKEIATKAKAGDKVAKKVLVQSNLKLVFCLFYCFFFARTSRMLNLQVLM